MLARLRNSNSDWAKTPTYNAISMIYAFAVLFRLARHLPIRRYSIVAGRAEKPSTAEIRMSVANC